VKKKKKAAQKEGESAYGITPRRGGKRVDRFIFSIVREKKKRSGSVKRREKDAEPNVLPPADKKEADNEKEEKRGGKPPPSLGANLCRACLLP